MVAASPARALSEIKREGVPMRPTPTSRARNPTRRSKRNSCRRSAPCQFPTRSHRRPPTSPPTPMTRTRSRRRRGPRRRRDAPGRKSIPTRLFPRSSTISAKLPEPVQRKRQMILDACKTGDLERIRPLLDTGDDGTQLSLGGIEGDPIAYLRDLSGDKEGQEILAILEGGHDRRLRASGCRHAQRHVCLAVFLCGPAWPG